MKGDFTRLAFDPAKRFSRVLMQQGRVQLDRDWNERQEIDRYLGRTALSDGVAIGGTPSLAAGFAIGLAPGGADLTISPGRAYVGGVLCELASATTLATQPDLPLATPTLAGMAWPTARGRYLAYLDVWERDVSALEDPTIGEPALGGPDTTARTRIVAQVRLLPLADPHATGEDVPVQVLPSLLFPASPGALAAGTAAAGDAAGPCVLPPQASYTSLTNQLYRVEIFDGGTLGGGGSPPTFRWSRDNGSVVTTVTSVSGRNLIVADLGPDDPRGFAAGQVVELVDDRAALAHQAGTLLLVATTNATAAQGPTIAIDPATLIPAVDPARPVPVLLRRWDQAAAPGTASQAVKASLGAPIPLEAGVQIQFQPGAYKPGDYWTIPARTAIDSQTGNVIWPMAGGVPLFLPASGPVHHYLPLALVDFTPASQALPAPSGKFSLVEDCRALFAPAAGRLGVMRARCFGPGHLAEIQDGQTLRLDGFAQGMMLTVGTALDQSSVSPSSVQLHAELPVTLSQLIPGSTDQTVAGTQPVLLGTSLATPTSQRVLLTPTAGAVALVNASLNRRLALTTSSSFGKAFVTHDFGVVPAVWQTNAAGMVTQTQPRCGMAADGTTLTGPSTAVCVAAANAPLSYLGASFAAGPTTGNGGLVFDYLGPNDYWVFYQSCVSEMFGETEGGDVMRATVAHYQNGAVSVAFATGGNLALTSPTGLVAWHTDLDVTATSGGLNFHCLITYTNGATLPLTIAPAPGAAGYPQALGSSGFGIMASAKGDLTFTRLQWTEVSEASAEPIPLGETLPVVVRLTARRTALRTAGELAALAGGAMPVPPAPEPDFSVSVVVTALPAGYYGYAALPGSQPGIGSELL